MKNFFRKFISIFAFLSVFIMTGCGEKAINEKIDSGYSLLEEKNYNEALSKFNEALKEEENNDIKNLCNIINDYLDAKKYFEDNDFTEAQNKLEKINKTYSKYSSLSEDIETLKRECEKKLEETASIDSDLADLENFINEERYGASNIIIDELEKSDLTDKQSKKFKELKEKLESKTSNNSDNNSETETSSPNSQKDLSQKIKGTWVSDSTGDTLAIDDEYINFYKYRIKESDEKYIKLEVIYNDNVTSDVLIEVLTDKEIKYYTKFDNSSNKFIEPTIYKKQ